MTIDDAVAAAPETSYPSSVRRTALMLLGSIAFVAAGVWMLIVHSSLKMDVGGALGVPFFGLAAVVLANRLVRRAPELVISGAGIVHFRYGSIPWSQVDYVTVRHVNTRASTQRFIELVLRDPAGYLAQAPRSARMQAAANRSFGFGPVQIGTTTLPVTLEEVLATMHRHNPQLQFRV